MSGIIGVAGIGSKSGVIGNVGGTVTNFGTDYLDGGCFNSNSWTSTNCAVIVNRTLGTQAMCWMSGGSLRRAGVNVYTTIYRGASHNLGRSTGALEGGGADSPGSGLQKFSEDYIPHAICTMDADLTISGSTTYTVYVKNSGSATWEINHNSWSGRMTLLVMEIKGSGTVATP